MDHRASGRPGPRAGRERDSRGAAGVSAHRAGAAWVRVRAGLPSAGQRHTPGPLGIEAAFSASLGQPLPETADQLRSRLPDAAARRLGLTAVTTDLRVTDLHEVPRTGTKARPVARSMRLTPRSTAAATTATARSSLPVTGAGSARGPVGDPADVAPGVPGAAGLTTVPGSRPVKPDEVLPTCTRTARRPRRQGVRRLRPGTREKQRACAAAADAPLSSAAVMCPRPRRTDSPACGPVPAAPGGGAEPTGLLRKVSPS
jgi:hypothetical protein